MRYPDPLTHLRSHLSREYLQQMQTTALSAAGFSAGIIVLLAQIKGQSTYSQVSLWAAVSGLLFWLYGAQYVGAYLVHREAVYRHFSPVIAALVALGGFLSLFVSVVATVLLMSTCAGIVLATGGLLLAIAVVWHFLAVERECNRPDA